MAAERRAAYRSVRTGDSRQRRPLMGAATDTSQIRLNRVSPAYTRVTFDNSPLNLMGPQFVREFREIVTSFENDEQLKVVVFDSAVEGFFLNHSDFLADFAD